MTEHEKKIACANFGASMSHLRRIRNWAEELSLISAFRARLNQEERRVKDEMKGESHGKSNSVR